MDRTEQVIILSGAAADQWGLVTAAQAKKLGLNAVQLKRLTEAGLLENVGRGVYAMLAAGLPQHLETKVAWLRLQPETFAWERAHGDRDSGVVSHASACRLHDLGDIPASEVEISVPRRRTTTEPFVRLRTAPVEPADITVIDGLPVTTAERTIVDLLQTKADGGHVGGVIADAERRDLVDIDELADRTQPFTRAYGLPPAATGHELIEHLVEQAGRHLRAQERVQASREGFAAAAQLLGTQDAAAVLASYAGADAIAARALEPYFRNLAVQQNAVGEAIAKAMPQLPVNTAIQQAVSQLHKSPAWTKLLREATVYPGLARAYQQAIKLPSTNILAAAQAAQCAATLPPDVQRAIQQAAATAGNTVGQTVRALQQRPPGSAGESAADAPPPDEEERNGSNYVQRPE